MLKFEWFEGTHSPEYRDALSIREKVFIKEQNVDVALEIDGEDDQRWHIVGYLNEQPVATSRVYFIKPNVLKIQRVAVSKAVRGQHIGLQLMQNVEKWAIEQGAKELILSAQDTVIPFYEKLGFNIANEVGYMDANVPHHDMAKSLKPKSNSFNDVF